MRRTGLTILREPFLQRPWAELLWFCLSGVLTIVGAAWVGITLFFGVPLSIVFIGLLILVAMVHGSRVIGGWHRALARSLLDEQIDPPEPFTPDPDSRAGSGRRSPIGPAGGPSPTVPSSAR